MKSSGSSSKQCTLSLGGGGGHSLVLVVQGCAALTTPFFRPRCPFSRPPLRSISVPMPIKIVEWSHAIAHPARRAGFYRCQCAASPNTKRSAGAPGLKQPRRPPIPRAGARSRDPPFHRSRPLQRPIFTLKPFPSNIFFTSPRHIHLYLPKCKSSAPPPPPPGTFSSLHSPLERT